MKSKTTLVPLNRGKRLITMILKSINNFLFNRKVNKMSTIEIICDGGCRNNQDPIKREAYGSFIVKTTAPLTPSPPIIHRRTYGNRTNNEAEYLALINALEYVKDTYKGQYIDKLIIKTDSQLLIGQLSKGWRVKQDHLRDLKIKVGYLVADTLVFPISGITFEKINEKDMKAVIGH